MVEDGEGQIGNCDRSDFPAFPFKPYGIQLDFMRAVYSTLARGGIGIFESPTGTGKTLSLICSSLQWLCDQHESTLSLSATSDRDAARGISSAGGVVDAATPSIDEEPDWMRDFGEKQEEKKKKEMEMQREKKWRSRSKVGTDGHLKKGISHLIENDESSERRMRELSSEIAAIDAMFRDEGSTRGGVEDDSEFLVEEWDSDNDEGQFAGGKKGEPKMRRKRARGRDWNALIDGRERGGFDSGDEDDEDGDEVDDGENGCDSEPLKIFFCSRTHSQLSQFIGEIKKTTFGDSGMRIISLGSRKTLCVNDAVLKLGSAAAINERCLELQKSSKNKKVDSSGGMRGPQKGKVKSSGSCPFLKKPSLQRQFAKLVEDSPPLDIEDLVRSGRRIGTCPYYGARHLLPRADLVILPYQSLLHKSTRESLGVKLKDSVVIFDEAHNLVDTVAAIHSYQVSGLQVVAVHSQLTSYLDRFKDRLAAGNRRHIQTLLVLTKAFIQRLGLPANAEECLAQCWSGVQEIGDEQGNVGSGKSAQMMPLNDFLFSLEIDNLNLFKLERYLRESNVVHKVISDARAVVLAGGTLQPINALKEQLFPQVPSDQMHVFSCGHIVPQESVLTLALAKGPTGKSFNFTFQSRSSPEQITELGRLMVNLCSIVPQGIVCFFPSFAYETTVYNHWMRSGILSSIEGKKVIFREPRKTSAIDKVLDEYRRVIQGGGDTAATAHAPPSQYTDEGNAVPSFLGTAKAARQSGAVMLCVVGGKLSEGINFSDGMGRCVVMVGLPYPSPSDPELVERMRYLDEGPECSDAVGNPLFWPKSDDDMLTKAAVDKLIAPSPGADNRLPKVKLAHALGRGTPGPDGQEGRKKNGGTSRAGPGREYYENLCMKAVNQSIGRAIRHANDYAAIILVDERYTNPSGPVMKLPGWIKERLRNVTGSFGEAIRMLHTFFRHNKLKHSTSSV
ncbi:hypothetical protein CBR_g4188 [Chara braunii]|uniref:Helicase ATP-binding domain-containing protein n=1 Tax=Chara braunii TaxID=69332 RepID=A0A388KHF9_CHABU|nr:hypothetical protein CBR_g4188 [Chara braunii]|eukprot:GBG69495.1 hypothetical protein CBR_g4188 [Chara braunii]